MPHCPPHDSLIHNHAVSLAIWLQRQLNAQLEDLESNPTNLDSAEQQALAEDSNLGHDARLASGAGSMMTAVPPESMPDSSSRLISREQRPPVELATRAKLSSTNIVSAVTKGTVSGESAQWLSVKNMSY
ncbi:hypothetical protein F0562_014718 [Nyssa sinensis]|uniref:Uncharacterized protein n=1 Tax=Nyssa sinensis TaxID=561372 RepID=A0A5J4ZSU8_9ASTE|nr:hypothetical protein F0562_014718 [Nyssa sinensis]